MSSSGLIEAMSDKKKKKKKQKTIYIDDGRTIADMSGTGRINPLLGGSSKGQRKRRSTIGEQWQTYWSAVKMMVIPMLVVMMIITAAFLIMFLMVR